MDGLQFDKAEFTSGAGDTPLICAACQNALTGDWYRVNEQACCASCKAGAEQALGGRPGPAGFARAVAGGVAGGMLGALLYYLVLAISGYEIGIIAIAVGFLVGKGVQWGTGGRGGPLYQALAIGLTYVAIVSTYVPGVIEGIRNAPSAEPATASAPAEGASGLAATPADAPAVEAPPSAAAVVIGIAVFAVLILALPFLAGFQNVIGVIIIGIGLYEAWKINKRVPLAIAGPFPPPAPAVPLPPPPPVPATPGA